MPFSLTKFTKSLKSAFSQLETSQAEALSIEIAANYVAGRTAGEKHKSTLPAQPLPAEGLPAKTIPALRSADPEEEEEGLPTEDKAEIALLVALFLGYVKGFNKVAQTQILAEVEGMVTAGKTQDEIKKYVDSIFEGKENIVIDNVGKTRKELYVDKNLKISEVEKVITKKYSSSLENYAQLLGERASHASYEAGRKAYLINQGYSDWIFSGPADERARPWHVSLLGEVYEYGSEQSQYAERCLSEPRCRHRRVPYYGDSRDVPAERWQKLKDDAGLRWSEEKEEWVID